MLSKLPTYSARKKGFTLIELLVVVLIMAVMGSVSYQMLGSSMRLESRTAEHARAMEKATRAFHWLQQDAEQYVDRPIRDELGEQLPSLILQNGQLSLTHLGWSNPLQAQRSTVQRVSYQRVKGELHRLSWQVLDRAQDSKPVPQALSEQGVLDIESMEFSVLSEINGETVWFTTWPEQTSYLPGDQSRPKAIALRARFDTAQFGKIERIFELPNNVSESGR